VVAAGQGEKEGLSSWIMRVDLHCHTQYSSDSLITFDRLLQQMDRRHLDMVAITDHNTIAGAMDFRARAPDRFLVGEEIETEQGELIALFLKEGVTAGLSLQETINRVRAQGGLVGVSHPLDRLRSKGMGLSVLKSFHQQLDFLEIFNARVIFPADNRLARETAARWGLPGSAGSDAHMAFEVGRAYVEMPDFDSTASFLESLAVGQVGGRLSSPLIHVFSTYAKWRNRLGAR
jgi:predicted metal-dependent phosphoesterase TrpH